MANNRIVIPGVDLERFKYEVAADFLPELKARRGVAVDQVRQQLQGTSYDDLKFEIASELGIPLQRGYNGHLSTREAGRIGGHIGGHMVRRMIAFAEQHLAGVQGQGQ